MSAELEGATADAMIHYGAPEGGTIPQSTHPPAVSSPVDPDDVNVPYISIKFQTGPMPIWKQQNGCDMEDVIEILIARLERFQMSLMQCQENADALDGLFKAKVALNTRTTKRRQQGVEGTNEPHV